MQLLLAVALAPLTLYFFQGASWISPLVNAVAVPIFVLLTPWGETLGYDNFIARI